MLQKIFGSKVKAAREALGLSQYSLADMLHVRSLTVSKWERGLTWPQPEVVDELAELVIDAGARNKNAGLIAQWKESFGPESVRYVVNHSKIATVQNDRFKGREWAQRILLEAYALGK